MWLFICISCVNSCLFVWKLCENSVVLVLSMLMSDMCWKLCFFVIICVLIRMLILFVCMLEKSVCVLFLWCVLFVLICRICVFGIVLVSVFLMCCVLCLSGVMLMFLYLGYECGMCVF